MATAKQVRPDEYRSLSDLLEVDSTVEARARKDQEIGRAIRDLDVVTLSNIQDVLHASQKIRKLTSAEIKLSNFISLRIADYVVKQEKRFSRILKIFFDISTEYSPEAFRTLDVSKTVMAEIDDHVRVSTELGRYLGSSVLGSMILAISDRRDPATMDKSARSVYKTLEMLYPREMGIESEKTYVFHGSTIPLK